MCRAHRINPGEGGLHVSTDEFLLELQSLCRKNGLLFLMDEVQQALLEQESFWDIKNQVSNRTQLRWPRVWEAGSRLEPFG